MGRETLTAERILELSEIGREKFARLALGEETGLPVNSLRPSQPDDGLPPKEGYGPLEVALVGGVPLVVHGNHRYHDRMRKIQPDSIPQVQVRRVPDPYTEY